MSRSQAAREGALERDGYRCQITGFPHNDPQQAALLEVHHWKRLGSGGSKELDTVKNCITLGGVVHEFEIHPGVSIPTKRIVHWNPEDKENGLVVEERVNGEWFQIPKEDLWFYRRQKFEELQPIAARIQGLHMIDGTVAHDLWRLWKDDSWKILDTEGAYVSWKQFVSAQGWDLNKATRLAEKWDKGEKLGIAWEENETETDFNKKLPKEGRWFSYLRLKKDGTHEWWRTADEDGLRDTMEFGDVLVKVGKTVWGVRADRGKLINPNGGEFVVKVFQPEEEAVAV